MSADYGYIRLHRCVRENPVVWDDRANRFQAWVDLLMLANYKDVDIYEGKKRVPVKRGTVKTSFLKLGARWGWDWRTAKEYVLALQDENMVEVKITNHGITINVVNYERYQGFLENDVVQNVGQNVVQNVDRIVGRDVGQIVGQNVDKEIKTNKDKEKTNKDKRNNNPPLSPLGDSAEEKLKKKSPSREDIQKEINAVIDESELSQEVKDKLKEFVEYRRKLKCKFFTGTKYFKSDTLKDAIKCEKEHGSYATIKCIENTFAQGYQGVFFNKAYQYAKDQPKQQAFNMDEFLKRYEE